MGAECFYPGRPDRPFSTTSQVMRTGYCFGPMPRHMAKAWRAIAPKLPRQPAFAAEGPFERVSYRLVPGFGARPDVLVDLGETSDAFLVLRSFEGRRPEDTVYAVWTESCRAHVICPGAVYGRQVFRLEADGQARDVTAAVMPLPPSPTALEQRVMEEYGVSEPFELLDKLAETSTTRWVTEYDPVDPPPSEYPRVWDGHFGFVIWDGARFELRERVPRALWPCAPWRHSRRDAFGPCHSFGDLRPGSRWIELDGEMAGKGAER